MLYQTCPFCAMVLACSCIHDSSPSGGDRRRVPTEELPSLNLSEFACVVRRWPARLSETAEGNQAHD